MTVARLAIDRTTNSPVVFLRELVGTRGVGIWIGTAEANAIALEMQGQAPPRPMTHDLCTTLLTALGGELSRVAITAVRDGTYLAELTLVHPDGREETVDARPSDALALALRTGAVIVARDTLLTEEGAAPRDQAEPLAAEALRAHLKRLGPEDFGRFLP